MKDVISFLSILCHAVQCILLLHQGVVQRLSLSYVMSLSCIFLLFYPILSSITLVCNSLNILSVSDIAEKTALMQAWKLLKILATSIHSGPQTRAIIPHPIQKGLLGNLVYTHAALAFNKLPMEIKHEDSISKAKYFIRKMF